MSVMRLGAMAGVALLGACATQPEAAPSAGAPAAAPTQAQPGRCDAQAVQGLVGQSHSEALAAEALRLSGARALRVIRPGMAVTMDYRTDRLNLELDASNKVVSARCG